jgi:hypothetical protein
MAEKELWLVTVPWHITKGPGVQTNIPAGEKIEITWENEGVNARVYWDGFQKHIVAFTVLVTREDLLAHASRM